MIKHTREELFDALRKTYLLGFPDVKPYENAKFKIQRLELEQLVPAQNYYIKDIVSKIFDLQQKLDINIFNLDGYISFYDNELAQILSLTPPIIEKEDDKLVILDGIHRVLASYMLDTPINCVVVSNFDKNYLSYAKPNETGWDQVKGFQSTVPYGFKTREHRYGDDYRKYARTFKFEGSVLLPRQHSLRSEFYRQLLAQDKLRQR